MSKPIQALLALGFTEVEARAYCELLEDGPCSAYHLASAIHRAPSNIYATLESLRRKGAILTDESEPRTFRAVPVVALLRSLEHGFNRHKQQALESLRAVGSNLPDDHLYNLKTVEQVFERARAMIAAAKEIVLFDLFPEPFRLLQVFLKKIAAKGTTVAGICYGDLPRVAGVRIYTHPLQMATKAWPGLQVTVVSDAKESLVALLTRDGNSVRHALWSDSAYLSCLFHAGLACEIQVASQTTQPAELGLLSKSPPGLRTLAAQAAQRGKPGLRSFRTTSPPFMTNTGASSK